MQLDFHLHHGHIRKGHNSKNIVNRVIQLDQLKCLVNIRINIKSELSIFDSLKVLEISQNSLSLNVT